MAERGVLRLLPPGAYQSAEHHFYSADEPERFGRSSQGMPEADKTAVGHLVASIPDDGIVVEIGSGMGAFTGCHPGYVALDYSFTALERYSAGPRLHADARRLPFRSASVDAFFSVSTLEHVPHPGAALEEIDRCLVPGGRLLIRPAWFVRPWASRALAIRPYSDLTVLEKLAKASIPVRDSTAYQFLRVLPGRVASEASIAAGRPTRFRFRHLEPRLDEYLTTDSDAFGSLDPHAVSAYFVSRGYRDLRRHGRLARLGYRHEPVLLQKAWARH